MVDRSAVRVDGVWPSGGSGTEVRLARRPRSFAVFSDVEALNDSLERRSVGGRAGERRVSRQHVQHQVLPLGVRDICHDLRQPLAAVTALVTALEDEPGLSDVARERLDRALSEAARLSDLLEDFLLPPAPTLVDVADVARESVATVRATTTAEIALLTERHAFVVGDAVLLSRVLVNLLQNAAAATGPGGTVRVRLTSSGGDVVVHVDDTGDGVSEDRQAGHGLGLTIVQAVVTNHGGRVSSAGSELGGLHVQVHLPLALPLQETP